jgi:5'-phosphate synthase pdxT subunit
LVKPVGVLALQGDFLAHRAALAQAGAPSVEVRRPGELETISGLIIPGGESTTLVKLIRDMEMEGPLRAFGRRGSPVLGTCAGAILLAARVLEREQLSLGLIDIDVQRNAYGRQRESFETARGVLEDPEDPQGPGRAIEMVFIRAPRICRVGPEVAVLARHQGEPVLVRQGNVLAGTFHPEMGEDRALHRLMARLAARAGTLASV